MNKMIDVPLMRRARLMATRFKKMAERRVAKWLMRYVRMKMMSVRQKVLRVASRK